MEKMLPVLARMKAAQSSSGSSGEGSSSETKQRPFEDPFLTPFCFLGDLPAYQKAVAPLMVASVLPVTGSRSALDVGWCARAGVPLHQSSQWADTARLLHLYSSRNSTAVVDHLGLLLALQRVPKREHRLLVRGLLFPWCCLPAPCCVLESRC